MCVGGRRACIASHRSGASCVSVQSRAVRVARGSGYVERATHLVGIVVRDREVLCLGGSRVRGAGRFHHRTALRRVVVDAARGAGRLVECKVYTSLHAR